MSKYNVGDKFLDVKSREVHTICYIGSDDLGVYLTFCSGGVLLQHMLDELIRYGHWEQHIRPRRMLMRRLKRDKV